MGGSSSKPREVATKWYPEFSEGLPDLAGKVVVVTGCTSGTGFVCARTCAQKGAHVVMLNRESERSSAAELAIKKAVPSATVETVACDLQSFTSTAAAAKELNGKFSSTGIDVLCCNAGVMALKDQATEDGYDVQMQTNHLSHFLLAKETFGLLELAASKRGEARIVNHSSAARNYVNSVEEKYLGKNGGNLGGDGNNMFLSEARWVRYGQTKLANSVWTQALHARLQARSSAVKAVCAAPGLASTNLQVTSAADGGMSETWIMMMSQSAEDGTMPLLQCCVGEAKSGDFIEPRRKIWGLPTVSKLSPKETDPEAVKMLWEASEKACGEFPL